jgi:uncharacterized RDD family membrane protein YckC
MHFFNRFTLQTPESVELEFTLAGIGNRAWALVIDYHVLGLLLVVFLIAWYIISVKLVNLWGKLFGSVNIGVWLVAIALIVGFFIYTGYFVCFETLWQGQTPGKRFAKIRVIRENGRPVGLQQATLRALLRPIDDSFFLGAFLIIFSRQEKRLGDWAAGTIVIQAESPMIATFAVSKQAQDLVQLLNSADLSQLLPDDFAVIREYLQRRTAMAPKARAQLSLQLAQQVQAFIALERLPADVTPDIFLEAIYLAYQSSYN